MANLKFSATLRNNMLDEITSYAGTSAVLKIYSGTQPAGGGSETTVLVSMTCDATAFAGSATGGVLTLNAIASGTATATGSASWWRLYQSDGSTWVMDGDISATGGSGDMELDDISIVLDGTVTLGGPNTITAPNSA